MAKKEVSWAMWVQAVPFQPAPPIPARPEHPAADKFTARHPALLQASFQRGPIAQSANFQLFAAG